MNKGDKSFGLVIGLDVAKSKAQIKQELRGILNDLNSAKKDNFKIKVGALKTQSQSQIKSDIQSIITGFNNKRAFKIALGVNQSLTTANFIEEINAVIDKINTGNLHKIQITNNKSKEPNATQKQIQSNKSNKPVPITNSTQSTFTSEQALNQYNQYVNRLEKLANEVKQKAIGSRNIKSGFLPNAQISIDDYLKRLQDEVYNQLIKDNPQNMTKTMYSRWEMLFHTLSTGVQEVESSLSTLDKQQSLTKIQQEWIAFAKQIDKSKFATEDLRNSVKQTLEELKNVNAGTTANDVNQIIGSLQNLKTEFKKQETNYAPINLKEREKQLQHYRSLLSSIENTKALSQQYTDLKNGIGLFSNAQTGTEYQQQLQSLKDIEKQIQNTQKQFGQDNIEEKWKRSSIEIDTLKTKLEKLGLVETDIYKKTDSLAKSLQEIQIKSGNNQSIKYDNTAFTQWIEQFKTLKTEASAYKVKADAALKNYYLKTNITSNQAYQLTKSAIDARLNTVKSEITKQGDKVNPEAKQSFEELTGQAKSLDEAYTQLSEKFKQVRPILQATAGDFSKLTDSQKVDLRTLRAYETSFNEIAKLFNTQLGKISSNLKIPEETKKSFNDLKELQQTISRFGNSNNRLFQNNYFKGQFSSLSNEINQILANSPNGQNISAKQVDDYTARWRTLRNEILKTGTTGQTFGTKLANQFSKLGVYFSAATVFMRIRFYMRSMYENVKEVDNAMTSLKRVTKETHETYQQFFNDSIDRAKRLGATLSDTINATADFTRLGYSINEATSLADSAIIYQQVGDEVEDIGTATSSIVSTMKAFGIQAEDSMSIVDRFNEVANNFSITAGGIGQALQNSASSLSAANNTLDESLGLIIAGNNVVQNPNEVGTALKTLTMRLRNAKADLSELGEDTDGMAESVSKLRGQIKALSGVDIMSSKDEFKSTYQILKELSKVWNTLTDVNQASLTELIAGKRQGNLMSSIMSNFSDAEAVVRVSSNSIGSAETEHEKKLQSINGKLNILQSTFEKLSSTVMEDGLVKGAIEQLTNLLELINSLVKSGGSLQSVMTILGTAFLTFNNKGLFTRNAIGDRHFWTTNYEEMISGEKESINQVLTKIYGSSSTQGSWASYVASQKIETQNIDSIKRSFIEDNLKGYNTALTRGIANTNTLTEAQKKLNKNTTHLGNIVGLTQNKLRGLGNTVKNVGLSFVNMATNMAMSFAVTAIFNGIISVVQAAQKATEDANQATQDFISRNKDLTNIEDNILALKEKLSDVNIAEDEALSIRKELYKIQQDMIDRYGTEAKGIDLVKDRVEGLSSAFENLRKKELRDAFINNAEGYQKSVKSLYGKDSINSFGWNTGREKIYDYTIKGLLSSDIYNFLKDEYGDYFYYLSQGRDAERTYYLNLGKLVKDSGGTKADLVNEQSKILTKLESMLESYREQGKETAQLEAIISNLSKAQKYWNDENYQKELANTQAYAEYLVVTNDKWNDTYTRLKKAKEDYDNAVIKGDKKLIENTSGIYLAERDAVEQLVSSLSEYDDEGAVKDFLQHLVDAANTDLTKEGFKLKIQTDENNLRTNLSRILKNFANGKKIFADDIINFNPDANANQSNQSVLQAFSSIKEQADEMNVSLETFVGWLVELGLVESDIADKKTYNFVKMLDMTSESMEAVTKKIDEVQSAFKTVKEVIEDYEDKKILTIDSAQKLIDLGDNYIQYLFDENGHLKINEEAYSKLTKAKIELLRAELLQNAIDNIKQIKTEADAVEYLKDKVKEETKATNEYSSALLKTLYLEGMSNKNKTVQKAVQYIYDTYVNYSRILDNVNTSYKANEMESTSVTKALNNQKDALEKQKKALEKSKQALDDNKQALEYVNAELEKDKSYIEDLVSLTVDMLKQKYEDEKETIENSKKAYKEKVDVLKTSLDEEKEAYDRYKSYTEKNKDISILEKQAYSLKGTQSVEGIQRLNEINRELSEKKQALYDEQYSNSINDRKDALDKEYERKEKIWDAEIKRIDELLKDERQLRIQAMNLIDAKTQQFYSDLWAYTYKYTTKSRFEFDNLWSNAYKALEKYGWGQLTCMQVMDLLEQRIYNNQLAVDALDRQIKILNISLDGTARSINGISREIDNLDEKINNLSKSYEKATETKDAFYSNPNSTPEGFQATLGGNTYVSSSTNVDKAASDILGQYNRYLETYAKGAPYHRYSLDEVKKQMVAYATGTSYSQNGLAIVDEDGLYSEWILRKGRVDYLPEGSVVFNRNETQALKILANSSDMVRQILNNADYLTYFKEHIGNGFKNMLSFTDLKDSYQNTSVPLEKNINMPLTVNINNTRSLNEKQLAKEIKDSVFKEINKYGTWYG